MRNIFLRSLTMSWNLNKCKEKTFLQPRKTKTECVLWSLDYYYKSWQPRTQVWAVTGRMVCAMVRRCSAPQHMEAPLLVNVVTLPKALCSRPIPMELCLWISMLPHKGITLITGKSINFCKIKFCKLFNYLLP